MMDNKIIEEIKERTKKEIEKLEPREQAKYHISDWLIKAVIRSYYKTRYKRI